MIFPRCGRSEISLHECGSPLNVVFRTDASLDIGTGHVMRCLTLADALRERGARCLFICRAHPGHLGGLIEGHGYSMILLPFQPTVLPVVNVGQPAHIAWLGTDVTQDVDASDTSKAIKARIGSGVPVDWLIVDHYGLDRRWESLLRSNCRRLMVIDDLADRLHDCDLLLDQNLGRSAQDYHALLKTPCPMLTGPQYALLRPEFVELRPYSLSRRTNPFIRRVLISMGGVDKDNVTGAVLSALRRSRHILPADCEIEVVMGPHAPHLVEVRKMAESMPWLTKISVNVADMAWRLSECDLAIGAAGGTSWERCSLGVPSLLVCLAENQRAVIAKLETIGAAVQINRTALERSDDISFHAGFARLVDNLQEYADAAAHVTDGRGTERVCAQLI